MVTWVWVLFGEYFVVQSDWKVKIQVRPVNDRQREANDSDSLTAPPHQLPTGNLLGLS